MKINKDLIISDTNYTLEQVKKNARNDWACLALNDIGTEPTYINVKHNGTVPMNYKYIVGDKLTPSGQGIRIGAGVKTVAVSITFETRWNSATGKPCGVYICKNGSQLNVGARCEVRYIRYYSQVYSVGSRTVLIPVNEGDILTLLFQGDTAMDINNGTGFTVQVVEYTD